MWLTLIYGVAFSVPHNPLIADGSYYSADPAPLVVGEELYVVAGRDEAPPDVNDFIMREWQIFATKDVRGGRWTHYPGFLRPEQVFAWATPGRAYASQMVRGVDGRFYFYAPVIEAASTQRDAFAIGVAVADSPRGPWRDAHPAGPIVSQSRPVPNQIQNIDPTVLVKDGRVFLYWGTFGQLRGVELEADMVTPKGTVIEVRELTGFFEAPWLFERGGTYYLAYAGNQAGPDSPCTPAIYHACIAYGTADSPLGPWTYRGVMLSPVSSTTSHPGIVEFRGRWYLVYHTADAKGGGHFRRSVAIDELHWDDSVKPARILPVKVTRALAPSPAPTGNVASRAKASASNEPIPVKFWIAALNDGKARENPLPPELWSTNDAESWIEYRWGQPVDIDGTRLWFWTEGAPPKSWRLEHCADDGWRAVPGVTSYPTDTGRFVEIAFPKLSTRCLRACFDGAVSVQEWEVLRSTR